MQRELEGVSYKAKVGSLMYAMVATRADIAFAVSTMSQFILKVGPPHWMAMNCIMRYLKGTLDFKIYLKRKDIALKGCCDAVWVKDADNQQSAIGFVFLVDIGVILWNCKKTTNCCIVYDGGGIYVH